MRKSVEERFFSKVIPGEWDECWLWIGCSSRGYGQFTPYTGKSMGAHRWAYEFLRADIPKGLHLDHLCHNRSCVNPWHLEPVTCRVNVLRAPKNMKTHCPHGHEWTPENTRIPKGTDQKVCRECCRRRAREYGQRKRDAAKAA